MDPSTAELFRGLFVRTISGVTSGVVFALAGWFLGLFFLIQPSTTPMGGTTIFALSCGVMGGFGAAPCWIRLNESIRTNIPGVTLAFAGGIAGGWIGLGYANYILGLTVTSNREGDLTAITAAGLTANFVPLVYFLANHFIHRLKNR